MANDAAPALIQQVTLYGLNILAAFLILIFGSWAARLLARFAEKFFRARQLDPTLLSFAKNLIYYSLLTFIFLAALGRLGVQTASFVAVIGAAGLAVGLALQGALSNFASGFLIILFRHFKVGDMITAGGVTGRVEEIQIFSTELVLSDGVKVVIPNSQITGSTLHNYTALGRRRLDLTVGVAYKDDVGKVKKVLQEILERDPRVLKTPAPTAAVSALAESSVTFAVRPWVAAEDHWETQCALLETIKETFEREGISLPFPQREVHVYQHPGSTPKPSERPF